MSQARAAVADNNDNRYRVLVEFVYRHLDFLMSDLESVLAMNGIVVEGSGSRSNNTNNNNNHRHQHRHEYCRVEPLLNQDAYDALVQERSTGEPLQKLSRRPFVILSFSPESKWTPNNNDHDDKNSNNSNNSNSNNNNNNKIGIGQVLLERCVLVRSVIELWGMAATVEDCAAAVQAWGANTSSLGHGILQQRQCNDQHQQQQQQQQQHQRSWKLTVHTLGSTYSREEQEAMRRHFAILNFSGKVQMKDPDDEYILIREVELDLEGGPVFPRLDFQKQLLPENDKRPPLAWYFGRVLGGRPRSIKKRANIQAYSLKKRVYLGPTSMDTELSLVMTNLGHVRTNSFVLDPFVGTGSILIASALRGAYCIGTDIDIRVLRGRNSQENVLANFKQYNLPRPELIRSDNSIYHRHFRLHPPMYDAILCDPPYGIRAGARKSGTRRGDKESLRPLTDEERKDHIPQTKPYAVSDVMADLLDLAARVLVLGGRLVYIIPSHAEFDPESDLPQHACLKHVHICYQPLSMDLGRRLVSMEKIAEYVEAQQDAYLAHVWKNGAESAEKCANIRDKIIQAAKLKPGYQEKLAIRKQKRKQHKEAKKKKAKLEQDRRINMQSLPSSSSPPL